MSIPANIIQLPPRIELPGPPEVLSVIVGSEMFVFDRRTGNEKKRGQVVMFPYGLPMERDSPATTEELNRIFRLNESGRISVEPKGAEQLRGDLCFTTEASFSKLTENESLSRLVAIWGELPGVKTVKRFPNRKTAVHRIWKRVEKLKPGLEPKRKRIPPPPPEPWVEGDTLIQILTMLKTEEGATLPELVIGTNCQPEHIRMVLNEIVGKQMRAKIQSFERADGTHAQRFP